MLSRRICCVTKGLNRISQITPVLYPIFCTYLQQIHSVGGYTTCPGTSFISRHTEASGVRMESDCSGLPADKTIHAAHIDEIHNVPINILIRPIPSILDEMKVLSLMETIKNPDTSDDVPPIDVLWITGRQGGDYFYSFGGCHRYEAFKRLKADTIPCKLFKSTVSDLKTYLGSSTPDLL